MPGNLIEIIETRLPLPTYLAEFLPDIPECVLIHTKRRPTVTRKCSNDNTLLDDTLELTGNPLEVDLNSSLESVLKVLETPKNWTSSECNHYPMSLHEARNKLNTLYNTKVSNIPTFIIAGGDSKKTALIGAHKTDSHFTSYLVTIISPTFDEISPSVLKDFKKQHQNITIKKLTDTSFISRQFFNLFGYPLKEVPEDPELSMSNGSVILEVEYPVLSLKPDPVSANTKLTITLLLGHKNSLIDHLWKQLNILDRWLKILSHNENLDGETVVSDSSQTMSHLLDRINDLCHKIVKREEPSKIVPTMGSRIFRQETEFDKLWYVLIDCKTLLDMKSCFSLFFKLADFNKDFHSPLVQSNQLLNSVLKYIGNMSSKLTFSDYLNVAIFVGLEKLKKDYFVIMDYYYSKKTTYLEKTWGDLSAAPSSTLPFNNITNKQKIDFLCRLHECCEMFTFTTDDKFEDFPKLSEQDVNSIYKCIYEKFLCEKISTNVDLKMKLLQISCDLNKGNEGFYQNKEPAKFLFEFVSQINRSTIKNIFHVSRYPIFPKCIYESDVEGEETDDPFYYVSKMYLHTTPL